MSNSTVVDFYIKICYNVKVHVTKNTLGSVVSDTMVCFLNLFTAAISICSNALVITVYVKVSSVKTSGNLLLVSLSTLELLKSAFVQPAFLVWKVLEVSGLDFCYFYLFTIIANNFCTVSSFLQTCYLITIERYLSVFHPIFHMKPIVKRALKIAIVVNELVWAFVLLFTFFSSLHRLYFILTCLLIVAFLTGTAVVYTRIRAKMRQTPIRNCEASNLRAANKQAADRRMNNTVISLILISLACYLPLFFVLLYLSFFKRTWWHTRYVIPWVYLMTFCTAALNPFVYCWKNRRLRNEMLKFTTRVFTANSPTFGTSTVSSAPTSQSTKV